ncbi:MAG TPA: hypothetical protein DHV36_00220 [Desulfobacteraceae bacterium]|nr:hypothetical protein [Desulfobacteraceae bacterium]
MAALSYDCSVEQGFNFVKDVQDIVGHITSLKIGDTELSADIGVTDPTDISGDKVSVVGVMSGVFWEGGYAHGITFDAKVSNTNQTNLAGLTLNTLDSTEVTFQFNVYKYDNANKKYYKCFHANESDLSGLVETSGGDLVLTIDTQPSMEVRNPLNFHMNLSIMPAESEQDLHVAVSDTDKFVKKWGVPIS